MMWLFLNGMNGIVSPSRNKSKFIMTTIIIAGGRRGKQTFLLSSGDFIRYEILNR